MRRNAIIAIILSLALSGCATYQGADGDTHIADPSICNTGACGLLVVGAMVGGAVALLDHK